MAVLKNTEDRYSVTAILIHWVVAIVVVGLFALGWWMVELDYYSEWYRTAPNVHKSVGVLLALVMALRVAIRGVSGPPRSVPGTRAWERRTAHGVHLALYALVFAACIAGYLISTADGRAISVFGWFDVPATITSIPEQEDRMGDVHVVLGVAILALAGLHALAALKHHFVDRDHTLVRMLGLDRRETSRSRPGSPISQPEFNEGS